MRFMRAPFWAAVLVCMVSPGCSCGGDDSVGSGSTGVGGAGGGDGGDGGDGGTTTSSGGGGAGGVAETGSSATETVSAGDVASSPGYKMIFTFGQPTQNQGKTSSPGYRLQGGLIGANGSLP